MENAKAYAKKDVIIIEHPENVNRLIGEKLTEELKPLIADKVKNNQKIINFNSRIII